MERLFSPPALQWRQLVLILDPRSFVLGHEYEGRHIHLRATQGQRVLYCTVGGELQSCTILREKRVPVTSNRGIPTGHGGLEEITRGRNQYERCISLIPLHITQR